MTTSRATRSRAGLIAAALAVVAMLMVGQAPALGAQASVTAVTGSAFGYWADDISLFGGAQPDTGPKPTVTLASDASNSPQSATAACGFVGYGPATLFTSDAVSVTTSGSVGTTGSVTTSSSIDNINKATDSECLVDTNNDGTPDSAVTSKTGSEILTADNLSGSATADGAGAGGSTTVVNGTLNTHHQADQDCTSLTTPCGRAGEEHTHDPLNPNGVVGIPANPPPNYKVAGHLHLGNDTTDYFVVVFNEQVINPDGSITVNPVHEYYGYKLDDSGNIVKDLSYAEGGSVLHGHLHLGQVVAGVTTTAGPTRIAPADFDGDGTSDVSVFRPANGGWYVRNQFITYHGREGDMPVPADYDGDGDNDVAVFRPGNGGWYVQGQTAVFHGRNGDLPVPADYDGDGDNDVAVFRPGNGGWYIQGGPTSFFGRNGDVPVPGHYDGDPELDLAVFRPANGGWYVQGQSTVFHGTNGDVPVPADYDGDGDTDIAVFRPGNGGWYIQGQTAVFHGRNGDVPVPGDYDGDGDAGIAVFRPANGGWYVRGGSVVYFGRSGDIPLPLPAAIYQSM